MKFEFVSTLIGQVDWTAIYLTIQCISRHHVVLFNDFYQTLAKQLKGKSVVNNLNKPQLAITQGGCIVQTAVSCKARQATERTIGDKLVAERKKQTSQTISLSWLIEEQPAVRLKGCCGTARGTV